MAAYFINCEELVCSRLRTPGVFGNWLCHLRTEREDGKYKLWNSACTLRGLWGTPVRVNEVGFTLGYFNKESVPWGTLLIPLMEPKKKISSVFMQNFFLVWDMGWANLIEEWLAMGWGTGFSIQAQGGILFATTPKPALGVHPGWYRDEMSDPLSLKTCGSLVVTPWRWRLYSLRKFSFY